MGRKAGDGSYRSGGGEAPGCGRRVDESLEWREAGASETGLSPHVPGDTETFDSRLTYLWERRTGEEAPGGGGMAKAIRVLVVDDEKTGRRGVRLMLNDDPDVEVVGEAGTAEEAVAAIRGERPDLLFLDVQLGPRDGFSVLRELETSEMPLVVFATAHDRYALQAFEHHAVDYLLKPFSDERFSEAVGRAKSRLRETEMEEVRRRMARVLSDVEELRDDEGTGTAAGPGVDEVAAPEEGGRPRRIMVRSSSKVRFVDVDDIDWIEAAGDYVRLHVGQRSHLHRETMSRLEERLAPFDFVRIHRSAIVRLDRIASIRFEEGGGHSVVLRDGTEHSLSRSGRVRLEEALGQEL